MKEFVYPEKGIIQDRFRKVIAVQGAARGAGATFVSMCLALKLAEMTDGVTFAEGQPLQPGQEGAFAVLSTDRKAAQLRWMDFYGEEAWGRAAGSRLNLFKNVNWAVRQSAGGMWGETADFRSFPGRYIIVDTMDNLDDADVVIGLIDPMPSRIFCGFENMKKLASHKKCPVIWVINKNNSMVFVREIERFTGIKADYLLDMIPGEELYRAQYGGNLQCSACYPGGLDELARFLLA